MTAIYLSLAIFSNWLRHTSLLKKLLNKIRYLHKQLLVSKLLLFLDLEETI